MNVWAYCSADWIASTRHAAGVEPVTAPPLDVDGLDSVLEKAAVSDLVYLNLHGFNNQSNYFGQSGKSIGPTALTPEAVLRCKWNGVVVFASVCFSAAEGASRAIAEAFLANGARAFIGSKTEAYGRMRPVRFDGEADRLGHVFRKLYRPDKDPAATLRAAMRRFRVLSIPLDREDKATLKSFTLFTKESIE